ncbi:hypothetical protein RD792_000453 [Penstemon davidsonii]|uniref:Uncharacterized protein n=1 Tax=Penstemon davidsonii TaxID=160366 RepID=A0ABR0DL36_9LAMI|nr:hypothetical protein RD792_000453 [Penstemon davidsonii]
MVPSTSTIPNQEFIILHKRNEDFEKELKSSLEREERTKQELLKTWKRLRVAEEGTERLICQINEFEAETIVRVREYKSHVALLTKQISLALKLHQENLSPNSKL